MPRNISLCLIVKGDDKEAEALDKCLASAAPYMNEICLTINNGESQKFNEVAERYKAKISKFEWCDDFSAARTFNFQQATGEWILWLDCDDTLIGGERLQDAIKMAEDNNISGLALLYKYGFDLNGNCVDQHWKIQLIKNDGHCEWKGAIHEDLMMTRQVSWAKYEGIERIHNSGGERTMESFKRNLRILLKEKEKNPKEPRNLFYLGRCYLALGEFQKAVDALLEYLDLSGWDEERYEASLLIGQCFMQSDKSDEAIRWYNSAILEMEGLPDAYIMKGQAYLKREEYQKAIFNFENALTKKPPQANVYFNPMTYTRDLCASLALCYLNVGRLDDAKKYALEALKYDPKKEETKDVLKVILAVKEKLDLSKRFSELAGTLEARGNAACVVPLLFSIPTDISDNPFVLSLRNRYLPPRKWQKGEIAVYCGNSCERWDGNSIKNGGIGGSETAVIEIGKRLAQKGWKVVVYNRCEAEPQGKMIDGVLYKNYWECNFKDEFNVFWCWRLPEIFDWEISAKLKLLDLHDTTNPLDLTEKRLSNIDKIMVKTKYHRSLYPKVADDKFAIIGNGINLDKFKKDEMGITIAKKPYKFIYASTPNRGLDIILEYLWDDIKKAIPEAELHTFYGWNTYYQLEKHNPVSMAWMKKCQGLMEKPGVINHGRVGQERLAKEELEASLWLYPTAFPEIHCITACEMQAAGVVPITSGYAALEETQKVGLKIEGDVYDPEYHKKFISEVIRLYNDKKLTNKLSREAADVSKTFSWDLVAEKWETICQEGENKQSKQNNQRVRLAN